MASFFEDFQEKKKKNRKTTMGSTMKTVTQRAKETAEQKKATAKSTTGKTGNTTTKSSTTKPSTRASALVDRHTDRKGRLYTPVDYMRLDAKNGNTGTKKIQQARASTTPASRAQNRERLKQEAAENRRRQQELRKIRISNHDKRNLNSTGQQLVREAKSAYDAAKAAGDRAGMAEAHDKAELTRKQYGYSGGVAGDEYISPELSREDRVGLNEAGIRQVKKARMDYEAAKQAGDKEGMKAAIRRETEIRRNLRRAARVQGPRTDAYGRSMWSGSKEDAQRETERMAAGFKAAGTGIAGSVLSLFETAAKSTDNYVLEQNRDYIEKTANDLDLWKARLKLAQQGQGDPSWGSIKHLEQRVRIAENLDKLRRSGSTVDPNALGQRLMRQSQEYTREATRGMEGPDRFLTETAISIGQNLPGMAAAAIPVVGPAVGAALMGAQAAGAKAFELNERGISPDEAFQRGLVSGGIELVTEKIPLSNLAKIMGGKSGANAAKNILKQMGVEASEESASYVANYLADKIAKDPKAEWSWQELMENAAAGAVSGGVFGTAGSMIGELRQKSTGTNVQNQVQDVERTVGTGVNRKTLEEIDQVSRLLGVQTRFADQVAGGLANAELRGNTITIERNNPNPVRFLYGHEITHRMQAVSPEGYAKFRDIIAREEGVQTQVEEVLREAGEMGLQYSRDQALDEVAADYAGALIENERLLQKFIQENRENKTLLQRMAEAFRELLDKLRGRDTTKIENAVEALELAMKETVKGSRLLTGREAAVKARRTAQEKRFLSDRRDDLMGQVIRDYQEGNLEAAARAEVDRAGVETLVDGYLSGKQNPKLAEFTRRMQAYEETEARYSFKRAGDTVAQQAQQMEDQGEDRETIWKETGAIRDTRGNWVEEVDDSGAKFYPLGDAKRQGNPDWVRLKALENKMLAGTITQEELEEARGLAQATRGMPNGTTLGDYLDHPELFQAAPGIENTPFRMEDIGTKGERTGRGITLNQNLPADKRLSTALHETQHELQGREGRPGGSSVEYWAGRTEGDGFVRVRDENAIREANKAVSQAFAELPAEIKNQVREMNRANLQKDYERAIEMETVLLEGPYGDKVQKYLDADFDMRMAYMPRELLPSEAYLDTAGEIEARETQRRMKMTAQERRENMPDLGWDQAVFADDSPSEQMSAEEKGAIHNELLEKVQATAQTLGEPLAELTGEEFTKGEKNLVQQVGEYFDQLGGQVERKGFGTVRLSRRGIKDSMGHGLGRKKAAAFAAVPEVIQNGVQIDYQKDWKGRGYETYVFAGGVTIAGESNVMGVVVIRRNEDNRFYLHEVTAIKKGDAATFKTGGTEDGRLPGDAESPSKTSIPGTEGESNGKLSTKGLSSYERAYEMVYGKRPSPEAVQRKETVQAQTMDRGTYQKKLDEAMARYDEAAQAGKLDDPEISAQLTREFDELDRAWNQIQEAETRKKTSAAEAIAKRYVKNYGAELDPGEIAGDIHGLYRSLRASGDSGRWLRNPQAIRQAEGIAEKIVDTAVKKNDTMYQDYASLRSYLKKTQLVVSPEVKADITDYGDFRKRNFGRLKLASGQKTNIDQVYQEMSREWPELFSEERVSNPAEQLESIADVLDDVYTITKSPAFEDPAYRDQAVKDVAASLMKTVFARRSKLAADQIDRSFATIPTPKKKARGLPTGREVRAQDTVTVEDNDYLDSLIQAANRAEEKAEQSAIQQARGLVSTQRNQEKQTARQKTREVTGFIYRKMVDSGDEIQKAGKQSGDKALYAYFNQAKAATAAANNMIGMQQSDIHGNRVGESLTEIFRPIKEKGDTYYEEFQNYLYHMHNVDRMGTEADKARLDAVRDELDRFDATHEEIAGLSDRDLYELAASGDREAQERLALVNEKNRANNRIKPVFGYEVTAKMSQNEAARLVGLHPEFRELAQKVYSYSRNLMQYRVDSGLITQELADKVQAIYPHYVPTFRQQETEANQSLSRNVRVGKTIRRAEGGTAKLLPLDQALAKQTMSTVREGSKNRFGQRLLNGNISDQYILEVKSEAARNYDRDWDQIWEESRLETENTFTVYQDGKAYAITMTPEMFEGVRSLTPEGKYDDLLPVRISRNANNLYKKLITAYNPTFVAKNFIKDMQDALLYTTDLKGFVKNYPQAVKEIATGGRYWKKYQALGGTASTVYDSMQGIQLEKTGMVSNLMGKIEMLNLAVEQAPRLAEFMSVVKKHGEGMDNLQEAMLAAADITTNFGRSGQAGKFLNANVVPFLNPSIQGFDKLVRTFKDNDRTVKAWVALTAKCAALGVAPAIINYLLAGDEEDYDRIRESDKDLNYLIPLGDGIWAKIPKGRVLSVFGALTNGGIRAATGKEIGAIDILETAAQQVGPINPLESNIMKAWMDADLLDPDSPGRTWYGTDLESQRLQNYRPGERYDEKTDMLSKAIGGALGLSPKKINYLLDQYTGVVGDLALPLLTPTQTTGKNPLTKPFVLDSVTSNKLSQEFYKVSDELQYNVSDDDPVSAVVQKYWNKVGEEVSALNKEIRKMESSKELDSKARRDKIRELKAQVNGILQEALDRLPAMQEAAKKYATGMEEDQVESGFKLMTWDVLGAKAAVGLFGEKEQEKAQAAYEAGASYENFLSYRDKVKTMEDDPERSETNQKLDILEQMTTVEDEEAAALWYTEILDKDGREKADELEKQGLPVLDYYRYTQAVKDLNGEEDPNNPGHAISGSKQAQRLPAIDALDLTAEQKDILWFLNRWSESTLWKAPWH